MHSVSKNPIASNAPASTQAKQAERTHGKTPPKPFVVDIDAAIVRTLGKNAAALYHALRRLADGKTLELRIRGQWLKAIRFDREARMCKRVRMAAMRELISHGLVTIERPRVYRVIDGRLRAVAGGVHYTVYRHPVNPTNCQKPKDASKVHLQKCISGTVQEMYPQVFPETPSVDPGSVLPLICSESSPGRAHHHHHPKPDEDDDVRTKEFSTSTPKANPQTENHPRKEPKISPALNSWMITRILARAKEPVKNRAAFLRKSRPEFLKNMDEEVEIYLQMRAEAYMAQRIEEKGSVFYGQVHELLQSETERHGLPVGLWAEDGQDSEEFSVTKEEPDSVYWRVYENAAEVLGLSNVE